MEESSLTRWLSDSLSHWFCHPGTPSGLSDGTASDHQHCLWGRAEMEAWADNQITQNVWLVLAVLYRSQHGDGCWERSPKPWLWLRLCVCICVSVSACLSVSVSVCVSVSLFLSLSLSVSRCVCSWFLAVSVALQSSMSHCCFAPLDVCLCLCSP